MTGESTQLAAGDGTLYRTEYVETCILCGSGSSRELFKVPPFGFRTCSGCGLVRLSPRVSAEDLSKLYDDWGREQFALVDEPLELQLLNPTFDFRAKRLAAYTPGPRLFEVGCGDGNFLAFMRSRGWVVSGSEANVAAAEAARERHAIDVHLIDFDRFHLPEVGYQVVGLYHVFEHLYDPHPVLAGIREALAPQGILHLQLPNRRSMDGRLGGRLWWGLRCPQHTFLYEPRHLRRLLFEHGFRVLSIETYDPWHSPGTMELTLRAVLKRVGQRVMPSPPTRTSTAIGECATHRDRRELALASRLSPGVRAVARFLARAESRVGFGNVADVVAVPR